MLFIKRKPLIKVLMKEVHRLFIASARIRSARNMIERIKGRKLDSVLIVTALAGIPVSSKDLASMNINAAIKDIEKTKAILEKVRKRIEKDYPHLYISRVKLLLEDIITVLEKAANSKENIDLMLELIDEASFMLRDLISELANNRILV
ncbi:MAG TPA: hypothetical protein ENG44_00190 [Desulfurococcaceae archaeon]|nr:hypothetical protein [Desulfurococcaceae archaeon]